MLRRPVESAQFRSLAYVAALRGAGLTGSMGRVAACADNAAMESFFSLLQKNVLNRQRWQTREQLRLAIVIWIEKTYHRRRRQDALGRLTPIEFETLHQTAHAACQRCPPNNHLMRPSNDEGGAESGLGALDADGVGQNRPLVPSGW